MTGNAPHSPARPSAPSRRRVLRIAAAACGLPLLAGAGFAAQAGRDRALRWAGPALGTRGHVTLLAADAAHARRVLGHCIAEIGRLERIFSLYDPDSELARLNRDGVLRRASLDMRLLVGEAQRIGGITSGAFDVTVQPLWRLYAAHFGTARGGASGPSPAAIDAASRLVDVTRLDVAGGAVGFLAPGMAATFNGIAQGYINDRIADLLRNEGFERVMVAVGEIGTLGAPDGEPGWRVAVRDPLRPDRSIATVTLNDAAIATSSRFGTAFDAEAGHHHLFDPATGRSASPCRSVSVIARRAMLADALSTALAVLPESRVADVLSRAGAERALLLRNDGATAWHEGRRGA